MNRANSNKWALVVVILCLMLAEVHSVSGQQSPLPIYETVSNSIIDLRWSTDGTKLSFQDLLLGSGVETTPASWVSYDLQSAQTEYLNRWPLQPQIPSDVQLSLHMIDNYGNLSFVQVSPNGTYGAYAAYSNPDDEFTLAIIHLQTYQYVNTPIIIYGPFSLDYAFVVVWSDDSNTLLVNTVTGYNASLLYRVTNIDQGFDSIEIQNVGSDPRLPHQPAWLWDVAYNGHSILLGFVDGIMIWDPVDEANNRVIITDRILGAAFSSPTTANEVMYFTRKGVYRYDAVTSTSTLIDGSLLRPFTDQGGIQTVSISPTGKALAVTTSDIMKSKLYIVDISHLALFPASTVQPQP